MEPREIRNVALLDLTGAAAANALEGVTLISKVAAILVPESLLPRLSSIPMEKVAATVPIPDGRSVKVMTGQVTMSGETLAAPPEGAEETLVIIGQLVLTSLVADAAREVVVIGQVLAPTGSETGLGKALRRMTGQVAYYPYTPGSRVVILHGGEMAGEALPHLGVQEGDTALMLGDLILTSNPPLDGYKGLVVMGNVLVPHGGEGPLYGRVLPQGGRIIGYDPPIRVFDGNHRIGAAFFEMLDEPITLVLDGNIIIEDDVTPDMVRQKVRALVMDGNMKAPRAALGALQAVALSLDGNFSSNDSDE
jgi:hypothetical protein